MIIPPNYALKFSEDFNGLDLGLWVPTDSQMFSGYGQETWDPAHVTAENGQLVLTADRDLHSGELRSKQSFAPPFYLECLAALPETPGFWPAFWTLGTGPNSAQEIDAFECDSSNPYFVGLNLHWGVQGSAVASNVGYTDATTNFQWGSHTYGVLYLLDRIELYIDGILRRTFVQHVPPELCDPMQIRLSLSIFGPDQPNHLPPDSSTAWPQTLRFDWVKLWQPDISIPAIDTAPPILSIVSPLDGQTFDRKKSIHIIATATDNIGVAKVDFIINGLLRYTATTEPYGFYLVLSGKPNATYKIEAIATDRSGNSRQTQVTIHSV